MNPVDDAVSEWLVGSRLGWLDPLVVAVTWLGSSVLLVPLVLAVGLAIGVRRRAWSPLALLAAALLGGTAAQAALKEVFARARPQLDPLVLEGTLSFPSGHATQASAVWLALAAVAVAWLPGDAPRHRALWWAAGTVAVAVALSRVYLGVHWLSDVLAGLVLGGGWALLLVRLVGRDLRADLARPDPPARAPAE